MVGRFLRKYWYSPNSDCNADGEGFLPFQSFSALGSDVGEKAEEKECAKMDVTNVTIIPTHRLLMDYEPRDFRPPKKDTFVYVFLLENGTIKIGKSIDVKRRKSNIECSSGMNIVRYWKSEGHTSRGASDLERVAHEHFSKSRLIGEFFNVPYKKAIAFIKTKKDYANSVDEAFTKEQYDRWKKYEDGKRADRDSQAEKCFQKISDLLKGQVKSIYEIPYLLIEIDETRKTIEKETGWSCRSALMYAIDMVGKHHNIDMSKLKALGKTEEEIKKEFEAEKKEQLWALLETANDTKKDIVRNFCIQKALAIISSEENSLFFADEHETDGIYEFAESVASSVEDEYGVEHLEALSCAFEIANGYYGINMRLV